MRLFTLLAITTTLALYGSTANACDKHKQAAADCGHAAASATTAAAGGCPHAKDAGAKTPDCCMKGATTVKAEGGATKATATRTDATAVVAEGHDMGACPYAKAREGAEHGCVMSKAALASATEFTGTGHVLCAKCDLNTAEACQNVFQVSHDKTVYAMCSEGASAQLAGVTRHGEKEVTVHGHLVKADDAKTILCVDEFSFGNI